MATGPVRLRIAFIHPDLGIGGAERLVVDAALGLQKLGHEVCIYTSHHDPNHCFDETRDGTLKVHHIVPPFPRSINGKFHILLAHLRQLHLTQYLLRQDASHYDVFFVDQLSTCVPLLRLLAGKRVLFYCHFPDKLLANGEFVEGKMRKQGGLLKRTYRMPMDWLEEMTTRNADAILANSKFTAGVFQAYFPSIRQTPTVVYPGINLAAYEPQPGSVDDPDIRRVSSDRPTLLSLNRFEKKKNIGLAIQAFAVLRQKLDKDGLTERFQNSRLVIAGGYDPRVGDNTQTLASLKALADKHALTHTTLNLPPSPASSPATDILFLPNFSTAQRTALLSAPSTRALLYTPANEHFGIIPVEAMARGLLVLAADSGGPTESVLDSGAGACGTGFLRPPRADRWAEALLDVVLLPEEERRTMSLRAKERAKAMFGMETMARAMEGHLREIAGRGPVERAWWLWILLALVVMLVAYFVR